MLWSTVVRISIKISHNTAYVTVSQIKVVYTRRGRRFIPNQEALKAIFPRVENSFVFALPSKCNGSRNTEAE